MVYRVSPLAELTKLRARGQRPDGPVIVGDTAWAARNGLFGMPVSEIGEDLTALTGLRIVVRMPRPGRHRELWQRMALELGPVCVFDTNENRAEWLVA